MARYVLNPLLPYDQSLLGLINNDNATVLVPPLKLSDVIFKNERAVPASANIPRQFVITMVNAANLNESIDLYYNKVHLSDMVTIPDDLIVSWYDPDNWDDARDLPKLKNALVVAMTNAGINPNGAISALAVTRQFDTSTKRWYLVANCTSYVFHTGDRWMLPLYLSEVVLDRVLDGMYAAL